MLYCFGHSFYCRMWRAAYSAGKGGSLRSYKLFRNSGPSGTSSFKIFTCPLIIYKFYIIYHMYVACSHLCTPTYKVKVKCTLVQALRLCIGRTPHRGSRGIALPVHDHGTRRGWGVSVTPQPLLTPGKRRYPLYWRLGGPQGRSGQVRKILSPPGFDPQNIQPVASRYTDYANRPTHQNLHAIHFQFIHNQQLLTRFSVIMVIYRWIVQEDGVCAKLPILFCVYLGVYKWFACTVLCVRSNVLSQWIFLLLTIQSIVTVAWYHLTLRRLTSTIVDVPHR